MQVTWETTRACGWKPLPARLAVRSPRQAPSFSTAEAFHLIAEVAAMQVPLLALTGGDPLLRADLFPIIQYASNHSVQTVLTLLPTPNVNAEVFSDLKACGLMRVGFWLHGSTPGLNDRHWGTNGLHRRTLEMIGACHEVQLPVHVNTIVARRNVLDIEPMVELLTRLDVEWWNVFFSVPASREQAAEMLTAAEHEEIFAKLYQAAQRVQFHIKTTEAPHYQRYILQRRMRESRGRLNASDVVGDSPKGVNEGQGFVFINHEGEVYPSRFLPVSAGNITAQSLSEMYSDSELFLSLRDFSRLKGKCGRCPMRTLCGGSRARAYAVTGDIFAPEPCCAYEP
jgi:radical SAM protein with 4Fe4S-binding SPASM domain